MAPRGDSCRAVTVVILRTSPVVSNRPKLPRRSIILRLNQTGRSSAARSGSVIRVHANGEVLSVRPVSPQRLARIWWAIQAAEALPARNLALGATRFHLAGSSVNAVAYAA